MSTIPSQFYRVEDVKKIYRFPDPKFTTACVAPAIKINFSLAMVDASALPLWV
jgi:hypothetical protein